MNNNNNNKSGKSCVNCNGSGVGIRYVTHHSVPLYHSAVADLRHQRTVHSVEHYPCLPDPQRVSGTSECGTVHYGFCVPVLLEKEEGVGRIKLDPVRALSSPELDTNLRNLVDQFVAREKAAHHHHRHTLQHSPVRNGSGRSLPISTADSPSQTPSPQGPHPDLSRLNVSNSPKHVDKTSPPSPSKAISKPDWIRQSLPATSPTATRKNPQEKAEHRLSAEETLGQLLLDLKSAVSTGTEIRKNGNPGVQKVGGDGSPSGNPNRGVVSGGLLLAAVGSCARGTSVGLGIGVNSQDVGQSSKPRVDDIEERLKASLGMPSNDETCNPVSGSGNRTQASVNTGRQLNDKGAATGTVTAAAAGKYTEGGLCLQSPVDFAKKRFQWTQDAEAQKKLEAVATRVPLNGIPHLVSETKTRFENGLFNQAEVKWKSEWLPSPAGTLDPGCIFLLHPDYGAGHSGRGTHSPRKSPSPEPGVTGSSGAPLPHPKLTSIQKQHIRERALSPTGVNALLVTNASGVAAILGNGTAGVGSSVASATGGSFPVRPFLTKGSVAERVLIFERCPVLDRGVNRTHQHHHPAKPLFNTWRTSYNSSGYNSSTTSASSDTSNDSLFNKTTLQVYNGKEIREPCSSPKSTLQRHAHSSQQRQQHIPKFYYPSGKPLSSNETDSHLHKIGDAFAKFDGHRASKENFGTITKTCQLPLYWKVPLFLACGGENRAFVTSDVFIDYWKRVLSACHDDASRFVHVLSKSNRNYLLPEDFVSLIQDVIDTHPGLTFLKEATEFHSRYVQTVIARIYYCVNRSWSGRISIPELRKSNFLQVLAVLDEENDINQITEYFSYEHFYVIYCKFWELDKDHDLLIDRDDLSRHNDNAISSRMVDRIFSGAVTRGKPQSEGKMTYAEFVWFLLSEEDKRHPTSIEYWFRCMDLDGDGYLSMYELEYFYEEQLQRMEALGLETLPFLDCLCQMLDMIQPTNPAGRLSLGDLKRCRMTPIFFDTFFNLEKYLDHEQKDPFTSQRDSDGDGMETSDWNRYAAEEYELLVAEEGATEQQDDLVFDEDYEQEELSGNFDRLAFEGEAESRSLLCKHSTAVVSDDDYADYAESDDYQY